jgi:hypothetical protein
MPLIYVNFSIRKECHVHNVLQANIYLVDENRINEREVKKMNINHI